MKLLQRVLLSRKYTHLFMRCYVEQEVPKKHQCAGGRTKYWRQTLCSSLLQQATHPAKLEIWTTFIAPSGYPLVILPVTMHSQAMYRNHRKWKLPPTLKTACTETTTNIAAKCSHIAYASKSETSLLYDCSLKEITVDKDTLSLCNSYYSSLYDNLRWKPCVKCQMKRQRGTTFTHSSPNPVTNCAKHGTTSNFPLSKKQQQWARMKI